MTIRFKTPLCGQEWLDKHRNDYTHEEIDALSIVIFHNNKQVTKIAKGNGKGKVKAVTKLLKLKGGKP